MYQLSGKTAIITGATGGLGSAVVEAFAAAGANIALVDLNQARLDQAVTALGDDSRFKGYAADLSTVDGVEHLMQSVEAGFGRIDILVHTVGGYAAGKPAHETSVDVLRQMLDLNVIPLYMMGGAAAKRMIAQGSGGKIIFVLAKAGMKGAKNQAAYTASKGAAIRIMEAMAQELKEHNIAVNGISPSIIDTRANREAMPNADPSNWVTPQQIARAMLYLASDDTGVYGANLELYGKSF